MEYLNPFPSYDRPYGCPHQSRSVTVAKHGIVATSHPLAAQAGLDVLKSGGNAVDAAIAANAMLGVVEPMSCGIGGDLFALVWHAKTERLHGLNASGRSPALATIEWFASQGYSEIPEHGPLSWSVPGCVDGWVQLLECFGTCSLVTLLDPSIAAAEEGFPIAEIVAGSWQSLAEELAQWPDSARVYLPDGSAPREGQLIRNPELGRSYRAIAQGGRDAFYSGEIAAEISRFSEAHGGLLRASDFAEHTSEWVEPVSTSYRGCDVWQLPPNGQGLAVLEMLNILEQFEPGDELHSVERLHLLIEAKKLAFADRAAYYADPAFSDVPIAELISKEYARKQAGRIDRNKAATDVPPGDPKLSRGDTVYISVVDKDRNACSLIQSIYHAFGSRVVPGNVGFALQNRGNSFALDLDHANCLAPGKRPFHTIIPGFVTKGGRPCLCYGVMGGDMQPQGQVQVLQNIIDFGLNVQAAGDAARVCHFGSQTPTGRPMASAGGQVALESSIPAEVREGLEARGHQLIDASGCFGGYQAILIDEDDGTLHGATEPRKDGAAVGY